MDMHKQMLNILGSSCFNSAGLREEQKNASGKKANFLKKNDNA